MRLIFQGVFPRTTLATRIAAALSIAAALVLGCSRTDVATHAPGHHDHDHEGQEGEEHEEEETPITEADIDMPSDFRSAVDRLKEYQQQIRAAIAAGHLHDTHRPLDELDLVITKLMVLARDSGIPRRDWEEINVTRRELRAQFDAAHATIDHDQAPDHAQLEQSTIAALARLSAIAARIADAQEAATAKNHEQAPVEEAQP